MTLAISLPAFVGPNVGSLKTVLAPGLPTVSAALFRSYGLRLLNAAYTGPLARVRRSSDNAEQDFQFVTDAVAWAGAGSAFVGTLYDQSGNGKHVVAPTAANQPRLINAGVLETIGSTGRPKLAFDGNDDYLIAVGGQGLYAAGSMSMFAAVSGGAGISKVLVSEGNSGNINPFYAPARFFSQTLTQQLSNDIGGNPMPATSVAELPYALTAAGKQITAIDTGAAYKKRVAGVALADVNYVRASTLTLTHLCIGASARNTVTGFYLGGLSEISFYAAALSDADRNLIEANQAAYNGLA